MIVWFNKKNDDGVVTFTKSNITLNKSALIPFTEVRYVMVGLDKDNTKIYIKPISNNALDRGDIDHNEIFKISISKSYARISSVNLIELVERYFDVINKKYLSKFDCVNNYLVVDLSKEVN